MHFSFINKKKENAELNDTRNVSTNVMETEKNEIATTNAFEQLMMTMNAPASGVNVKKQETHQKMIERVKEYHGKLDLSQYKGEGKVDLFVCCICFEVFPKQELLRNHFITVSSNYLTKKCVKFFI